MDYQILTRAGLVPVTGQPVKLKPKDAAILAVRAREGLPKSYMIDHVPTGKLVAGGYCYSTVARTLAKEILKHHRDELKEGGDIPVKFRMYLNYYALWEVKECPSFTEWLDSDEGQRELGDGVARYNAKVAHDLYHLGYSIGWVSED